MGNDRRRRHPRIAPLVIRTSFDLRGKSGEAYATSLSEGGAFLACEEDISDGETLSLRFSLPWGLGEIEAEAKVAYVLSAEEKPSENSTKGIGVAFVAIDPEDQEKIRTFVDRFHRVAAQLTGSAAT